MRQLLIVDCFPVKLRPKHAAHTMYFEIEEVIRSWLENSTDIIRLDIVSESLFFIGLSLGM